MGHQIILSDLCYNPTEFYPAETYNLCLNNTYNYISPTTFLPKSSEKQLASLKNFLNSRDNWKTQTAKILRQNGTSPLVLNNFGYMKVKIILI